MSSSRMQEQTRREDNKGMMRECARRLPRQRRRASGISVWFLFTRPGGLDQTLRCSFLDSVIRLFLVGPHESWG